MRSWGEWGERRRPMCPFDLREQRVVLTVAGHMRALAFLAVRLETARLTAEGSR